MKDYNYTWLNWAKELQAIAQNGLAYTQNPFDEERYTRLREISAEIMSLYSSLSVKKVMNLFCNEQGFQTPKIDTRAAIFKNNKILLVKENDGRWSLPGGWCDFDQTIKTNTEKEVLEEAGLIVKAIKIIAIQDRNKYNKPICAYNVCKFFILCKVISGEFRQNIETIDSKYFSKDELPILSEDKNTKEQIEMCFEAKNNENWITLFD